MLRVALRIIGFEVKGLVAVAMWLVRRKHGVPGGATAVPYVKAELFTWTLFAFAMAVETVVLDLLLVAIGAPAWLRYGVLAADLYGLAFVAMLAAACATRPHVVTPAELRVRYGVHLDLRVPRELVASVTIGRSYNEKHLITVRDGRLTVAVASQTNVTVELTEPVVVVRPLGRRAEVSTLRIFADAPERLVGALRREEPAKGL